jgi:hypothetical protein
MDKKRMSMKTSLLLAGGLFVSGHAAEGLWRFGVRLQGTLDFEPGNDYSIGPEVAYSDSRLADHGLQVKFGWLTSRLEQVFRKNIIKQDYFLLTPVWHFRRDRLVDPTVQFDLGYTRFDVENEKIFGDLDNDAWIAAPQAGLNVNLAQGLYGAYYHFGYNLITSALVYPAVFGPGIWMRP